MTITRAGESIDYTITFLEQTERPAYPRPSVMGKAPTALLHGEKPPRWYFLSLYDAVGQAYEWVDAYSRDPAEVQDWLNADTTMFYTLLRDGWPHGFFVLDRSEESTVELRYFGLVPEAIGQGLGTYLLRTAVHMAWDIEGTRRVFLSTCTLDHPRALQHYQKNGFQAYAQETRSRILTRERDPSRFA